MRGPESKGKWPVSVQKLPRAADNVPGIETVCTISTESTHFGQIRQHNAGDIHKSLGWHTLSSASQSGTKADCVAYEPFSFLKGNSCSGNIEYRGRSPAQRQSSVQRIGSPPSGGKTVIREIRLSSRRSLRLAQKCTLPSAPVPVAKCSVLGITSTESKRANFRKSKRTWSLCNSNCSKLAREIMTNGDIPGLVQSGSLGLARECNRNYSQCESSFDMLSYAKK